MSQLPKSLATSTVDTKPGRGGVRTRPESPTAAQLPRGTVNVHSSPEAFHAHPLPCVRRKCPTAPRQTPHGGATSVLALGQRGPRGRLRRERSRARRACHGQRLQQSVALVHDATTQRDKRIPGWRVAQRADSRLARMRGAWEVAYASPMNTPDVPCPHAHSGLSKQALLICCAKAPAPVCIVNRPLAPLLRLPQVLEAKPKVPRLVLRVGNLAAGVERTCVSPTCTPAADTLRVPSASHTASPVHLLQLYLLPALQTAAHHEQQAGIRDRTGAVLGCSREERKWLLRFKSYV
jgi:hypothetical protein